VWQQAGQARDGEAGVGVGRPADHEAGVVLPGAEAVPVGANRHTLEVRQLAVVVHLEVVHDGVSTDAALDRAEALGHQRADLVLVVRQDQVELGHRILPICALSRLERPVWASDVGNHCLVLSIKIERAAISFSSIQATYCIALMLLMKKALVWDTSRETSQTTAFSQ